MAQVPPSNNVPGLVVTRPYPDGRILEFDGQQFYFYTIGPAPEPCTICRYNYEKRHMNEYLHHCIPKCAAISVRDRVVYATSYLSSVNDIRPCVVYTYGDEASTAALNLPRPQIFGGLFTLPNRLEVLPSDENRVTFIDHRADRKYIRTPKIHNPFRNIYDAFPYNPPPYIPRPEELHSAADPLQIAAGPSHAVPGPSRAVRRSHTAAEPLQIAAGPSHAVPGPSHAVGQSHTTVGSLHFAAELLQITAGPSHAVPGPSHAVRRSHTTAVSLHSAAESSQVPAGPSHAVSGSLHSLLGPLYYAAGPSYSIPFVAGGPMYTGGLVPLDTSISVHVIKPSELLAGPSNSAGTAPNLEYEIFNLSLVPSETSSFANVPLHSTSELLDSVSGPSQTTSETIQSIRYAPDSASGPLKSADEPTKPTYRRSYSAVAASPASRPSVSVSGTSSASESSSTVVGPLKSGQKSLPSAGKKWEGAAGPNKSTKGVPPSAEVCTRFKKRAGGEPSQTVCVPTPKSKGKLLPCVDPLHVVGRSTHTTDASTTLSISRTSRSGRKFDKSTKGTPPSTEEEEEGETADVPLQTIIITPTSSRTSLPFADKESTGSISSRYGTPKSGGKSMFRKATPLSAYISAKLLEGTADERWKTPCGSPKSEHKSSSSTEKKSTSSTPSTSRTPQSGHKIQPSKVSFGSAQSLKETPPSADVFTRSTQGTTDEPCQTERRSFSSTHKKFIGSMPSTSRTPQSGHKIQPTKVFYRSAKSLKETPPSADVFIRSIEGTTDEPCQTERRLLSSTYKQFTGSTPSTSRTPQSGRKIQPSTGSFGTQSSAGVSIRSIGRNTDKPCQTGYKSLSFVSKKFTKSTRGTPHSADKKSQGAAGSTRSTKEIPSPAEADTTGRPSQSTRGTLESESSKPGRKSPLGDKESQSSTLQSSAKKPDSAGSSKSKHK